MQSASSQILVYGATGYTGKLFAKFLIQKGITPILAGRSETVKPIGQVLGCPVRIFSVEQVGEHLQDVCVVVNLAGPFGKTQTPLIKACLASGTHYLDIAGEVPEVASAFAFQDKAKAKGISIVPAAGFGVVPTDIAAKLAATQVEEASFLTIAYATEGGASRGTLKTVLKDIDQPGSELVNGTLVKALPAKDTFNFQVQKQSFKAVYNPWRADLFTAQQSTGIGNISTYSVFPGFVVPMMHGHRLWLRNLLLKRLLRFLPEGPNPKQLAKGSTHVFAKASNALGTSASVSIRGPEAYQFTVEALWLIGKILLHGHAPKGVLTPSQLGTEWIKDIEGIQIEIG